ncbi:beta-mannosidase [Chitinophaga parva]|uniref:Beta-mannosidase n=1 Tax=Chitinophaga parva TaxID=2169414 RepID=A0A2T7BGY1_9BACT|nr:discoidin domain-containing protein [Chitinophaga parva]PUZ25535.1 beta-mannosidase [Chitinophaga parva]
MKSIYPLFGRMCRILCLLGIPAVTHAQLDRVDLGSSSRQDWYVKAAAGTTTAKDPGIALTGWTKAIVPGTTFGSFVAAGLEQDPNFGDNINKVDRRKYDQDYWYRTTFTIPAAYGQKRTWLNFDGVNRKASVYVNGTLVGSLDGFMTRGHFDITRLANAGAENTLAVLVSIPRQPLANAGSPNYLSSAGWDWMPYVPGLNSGITDKVYLTSSGDLTLQDTWVRSELPTNAKAYLSVSTQVQNHTGNDMDAILEGTIMPGNIRFSKKIRVNHGNASDITLSKRDMEQLVVNNPKLWWPNGYGDPNCYTLNLQLRVNDQVTDAQTVTFGIRRYSYDTTGNVLHIAINGTPVFIKGGDWGMSEYMLRCRGAEYDLKIRLHKDLNFNMIRNWLGSVTDPEFYEACDKYGIMVWDEFWLNANSNLPADLNAFNANAIEKIKRFRNHPSIAIWCGENEGWPEPPLRNWLQEDVRVFDGDDRYYQSNSHADNLTGSGPWGAHDPRYYFTAYPTGSGGNLGWGLRSELGTAVFVNFESFKKFMPQDKWWPRNEMWNQHYFGPNAFNADPDGYDRMITEGYGKPKDIEDYCRKAQFVNLESNRAMYEGWLDHMGEDASGIMTWMSQSAYPSMVWQTYDYYYDLTGAYFGVKKACEPLHIQWNPVDNAIKVINTTRQDVDDLTATAEIYNLDGHIAAQYTHTAVLSSPAHSAATAFALDFNTDHLDLAKGKNIAASSAPDAAANANDGNPHTRWSSRYNDDEWLCVDLGREEVVNGVGLTWEDAYAKTFKIEVSNDNEHWQQVYKTDNGHAGPMQLTFPEVTARYVRMHGMERGSGWGYSLFDFAVYQGDVPSSGLSDVHFIKLKLTDSHNKLVSENLYWRGNKRKDYTALNTLQPVNLSCTYTTREVGNRTFVNAVIKNPASSKSAAFGIRMNVTRNADGQQVLPVFISDNYFTLMPGETKTVQMEYDNTPYKHDSVKYSAAPYNNYIVH